MWYNLSLRGFNFPLGHLYKLGVYTKNVTVSFESFRLAVIAALYTAEPLSTTKISAS